MDAERLYGLSERSSSRFILAVAALVSGAAAVDHFWQRWRVAEVLVIFSWWAWLFGVVIAALALLCVEIFQRWYRAKTSAPNPHLSIRSDLVFDHRKDAVGLIVKNEGTAGRFRSRISILHDAWSHAGDDLPAYWSEGIEDDGRVLIGEGEEARIWISRFQSKGSLGLDRHIFYLADGSVQEATAYEPEKYRWVRISQEAEEKTTERSRVAVKVNLTSVPPSSCGALTATIEMSGNAATMQIEPAPQSTESKS